MPRPRLVLAAALAAGLSAACAEPPPPNVLVVVVDTLRRDHLGCYGYPRNTSPEIDRFAAGAVRYAHAAAAAPWTTPSIGALLTSRYPSELGITEEPDLLDDRFVLLSEVLSANGYETGAVVAHYFVNAEWNFDQGFDLFDQSNVLGHEGISSPGVTDTALAFLRRPRRRPFFLFVHYFDPHYHYREHAGFTFPAPGYDGPIRSGLPYEELLARLGALDAADRARLVDLYDSEIAFTDHHFGRLLDGLDELGLAEDTLVVLTADHGEEILERGWIGHGNSLYEEQIGVPLVVRYPGGAPGVVERSVGLIDVYPTVLAALGIAIDHRISGRSLLDVESSASPRPVFAETDWGGVRAVVLGRLKLVRQLPHGPERLFDLAADPGERDDLMPRLAAEAGAVSPFEAGELRRRLSGWLAAMEAARGRDGAEVELSEEDRARLRALGYLRPR